MQLQHLLSLWKILEDSLEVDPFSNVLSAYKKGIEEEQKIDLKGFFFLFFFFVLCFCFLLDVKKLTQKFPSIDAAPFLDLATLLPAMKEFMMNYLGDSSTLGPDYYLKDVLSPYTGFLLLLFLLFIVGCLLLLFLFLFCFLLTLLDRFTRKRIRRI